MTGGKTGIRSALFVLPGPALVAALLVLFGVSQGVLADEAADRRALEAAAQAWTKAFNARNADGLLALTTEDVVLLVPDMPPISGRGAARRFVQRALGAAKGQLTNATKEIVIAGDVAWRVAALAHELPDREIAGRGQSLEVWKRVRGQWKIHRQMSSGLLVAPRLAPRPVPSEPVPDNPVD